MKKVCGCKHRLPKPKKCYVNGVELNYIEIPASMGTSAPGQPFAPENGAHRNAVVKYEADGHVYIYTSEGIPVQLSDGGSGGGGDVISVNGKTGVVVLTTSDIRNTSDYQTGDEVLVSIENALSQLVIPTRTSELVNDSDFQTGTEVADAISAAVPTNVSELANDANYQNAQQVATAVAGEATLRQNADNNLQSQIDAISASSDVTDIVGTYAELQAYDTSTLGNNDIIKVLQDESRNGETTYYRWSTTTQTFTLIGEEGPYYTKSQADGRFVAQTTYTTDKAALEAAISAKQNTLTAGANVNITGDVISATDTTYSDFTGTDGTAAGTAGLVPAPAATDAGKYLKADGTWGIVGAEKTVSESDYDPVTNRLILWNLEAGVYKIVSNNDANYLAGTIHNGSGGNRNLRVGGILVVNDIGGASATPLHKWVLYPDWVASYGIASAVLDVNGTLEGYSNGLLLGTSDVVNNLTSTSSLKPLSANQGRLLNINKQNKLTAGQNIAIDENDVISASGISASVSNHTLFV